MLNNSIVLAEHDGVFYEGNNSQLWVINPAPVISPAKFEPALSPVQNSGVLFSTIYFREDYFDSTTRIRRGRFYGVDATGHSREWDQNKISSWPRPPLPRALQGLAQMHMVYRRIKIDLTRKTILIDTIVSLGNGNYKSDWRIIDVEQTTNDELLFTIKSAFPFGVLPTLKTEDGEVRSAYENVLDAALKYAPVPVVDVCRESCCVLLSKKFSSGGDLADLIKKIPDNLVMVSSAARIINRLHPRGKTAERGKHASAGALLRPIIDDDATLAVRLFGFLLVELEYATS